MSFDGTNDPVTRAGRGVAEPRVRDDARGVGEAHGDRRLADRGDQGAAQRPLLRAVRLGPSPERVVATDGEDGSAAPRARPTRTRGRTSPRPTTARRCGVYVNGVQVGDEHRAQRPDHAGQRAAVDRRQRDLGRVVQRPHRRGPGLRPAADAPPRSRADMAAPVGAPAGVAVRAAGPDQVGSLDGAGRLAAGRRPRLDALQRQGRRLGRLQRRAAAPSTSGTPRPARSSPTPSGINLFCAGHVLLPDGRLFVAGGHELAYVGLTRHDALQPADRARGPPARTWPAAAGTRRRRRCPTAAC